MTLRLNSKVMSVDPRAVTATLETGERFSGDLIIGADGIKSIVQEAVVDGPTYPYRRIAPLFRQQECWPIPISRGSWTARR
jgi:2-polyprenyl-6-methoxyphenol hydroxylase-like FAD-dependent oxidoreductase